MFFWISWTYRPQMTAFYSFYLKWLFHQVIFWWWKWLFYSLRVVPKNLILKNSYFSHRGESLFFPHSFFSRIINRLCSIFAWKLPTYLFSKLLHSIIQSNHKNLSRQTRSHPWYSRVDEARNLPYESAEWVRTGGARLTASDNWT